MRDIVSPLTSEAAIKEPGAHVCEELVQAEGVRLGRVALELHRLPVGRGLRRGAVVHPLEALVRPEAPRVFAVAVTCGMSQAHSVTRLEACPLSLLI